MKTGEPGQSATTCLLLMPRRATYGRCRRVAAEWLACRMVPVAQLDRAARPSANPYCSPPPPPRRSSNFFRPFSAGIAPNPPQSARADGHFIRGRFVLVLSPPKNSQILPRGYFFGLLFEQRFPARPLNRDPNRSAPRLQRFHGKCPDLNESHTSAKAPKMIYPYRDL